METRTKLTVEELGRKTVEEFKQAKKYPIVVVLDNIRSMNNVGSIFRTCDAFLVERILLCGITPQPPHRDIQKTALGATESVEWKYEKSTIDAVKQLKEEGYTILSVEQTHNSLALNNLELKSDEKIALIMGNEVDGVEQNVIDISDKSVEIPQFGTKHSLNVCNSCAIVLWQVMCQYLK